MRVVIKYRLNIGTKHTQQITIRSSAINRNVLIRHHTRGNLHRDAELEVNCWSHKACSFIFWPAVAVVMFVVSFSTFPDANLIQGVTFLTWAVYVHVNYMEYLEAWNYCNLTLTSTSHSTQKAVCIHFTDEEPVRKASAIFTTKIVQIL